MASGTYGIVRSADVDPSDVEITVFYSPNRQTQTTNRFTLSSNNLVNVADSTNGINVFGGFLVTQRMLGMFKKKSQ